VIVVDPTAIPTTTPLEIPTDAIAGTNDVHVPPGVASLKVEDAPWQTEVIPVIPAGSEFTVTYVVAKQPAGDV